MPYEISEHTRKRDQQSFEDIPSSTLKLYCGLKASSFEEAVTECVAHESFKPTGYEKIARKKLIDCGTAYLENVMTREDWMPDMIRRVALTILRDRYQDPHRINEDTKRRDRESFEAIPLDHLKKYHGVKSDSFDEAVEEFVACAVFKPTGYKRVAPKKLINCETEYLEDVATEYATIRELHRRAALAILRDRYR